MYLETHMHELRLEQERANRLASSSFYYIGMTQVKGTKASNGRHGGDANEIEADWLDS